MLVLVRIDLRVANAGMLCQTVKEVAVKAYKGLIIDRTEANNEEGCRCVCIGTG